MQCDDCRWRWFGGDFHKCEKRRWKEPKIVDGTTRCEYHEEGDAYCKASSFESENSPVGAKQTIK